MLIEEAPIATCLFVGEELVMEVVNQPMLDIFGKGNHIRGMKLIEVVPELSNQSFPEILRHVLRTGETYEAFSARVELVKDGIRGTYYFDFAYKPLRNEAGEVYAVLDMALDVTERVLAHQKVEASQRSLLSLFEESPVGIATLSCDDALVFQTANTFYGALVGRHPQEIIGKPFLEALPEISGQGFEELLKSVVATGKPFLAEEVSAELMRNGLMETIYVNLTFQPRQEANIITGILVVATDVTEQVLARKKVEEKDAALEDALEQVRLSKEAAELGTFDMNMQSGDMHWDDRCRLLFGISHQEPVSYEQDFIERLHPDDQQRVLSVLSETFDKSISNGDYDVEYRTIGADDGIIRWVRAKGKVYFDTRDQPFRFIGSVLDITEQKTAVHKIEREVEERTKELAQANDTLQVINKELKRSNQQLEEFTHAASHDLKEPVRKIQTFTSLLKDQLIDSLKPSELRSFNRIEDATKRMGNLIDDLLLYSHVSQHPWEAERVDLNENVQRVLEDLDLYIEEKKAIIEVGQLPVVQGYRRQLQQLFQNLISNALKYGRPNLPPIIRIVAEELTENGMPYYVISITDNGIGFEQEYAEKIFQIFARLHTMTEYSGTGVGLSIVKKVVENHNGFIRVESVVQEGSVFKVYLPA